MNKDTCPATRQRIISAGGCGLLVVEEPTHCPECGTFLPEGSRSCPNCGYSLPEPIVAAEQE